MRAVTFTKQNTVEVIDKDKPAIQSDEVLLKVTGAGICHSDLAIIGFADDHPLVGCTLGHEVAGTVCEIGSEVRGWSTGEHALVSLILSCGDCRECHAGRDNQCESAYPRGAFAPLSPGIGTPGGMADFIAVKARHLNSIGELNPVAAAPLADAALTPMHAITSVRDRLTGDAVVAVIGLGGLGHMGLQLLRATTGARIIALEKDPQKLENVALQGAIPMESDSRAAQRILELTGGKGVDVVLDFVGAQLTIDTAVAIIRSGGAIRFIGLGRGIYEYATRVSELPWGVNIERAYGGTQSELRQVIALAQAGQINVHATTYPLEQAAQAFADLEHGRVQGRAVLVP